MNLKAFNFRRQFDPDWFRAFQGTYETINPDRPKETANMPYADTAAYLRDWVRDDAETKAFAAEFAPQLGSLLQGPFPMPGGEVLVSAWDCRGKVAAYEACGLTAETLRGKRCLDVGSNAGYDVFLMHALGAAEVVGMEPHGFYHHAQFLNALYDPPGVSFHNLGWEDLDARYLRDFDYVTCLGLLYHIPEPTRLLDRLAAIMRPGAKLVLETHVLAEPSSQALFIEGAFWGDETYWWIHGDACLEGLLRLSGFHNVDIKVKMACHSRNPADPAVPVEGYPAGARAWVVAEKR